MEPPAYSLCEEVPEPPQSLCEYGRVLWGETATELFNRRLLTVVNLAALEIYCAAFARTRDLNERIGRDGYTIENSKGWVMANPEIAIASQSAKLMMSLAKEFGFTPGSQSRIAIVPEPTAAVDPLEAARAGLLDVSRKAARLQ